MIDLHCDLLGSIDWSGQKLGYESPETNCSLLQLEEGGVKLQVLAISGVPEMGSPLVESGQSQILLYEQLLHQFPHRVGGYSQLSFADEKLYFLLGIENAAVLAEEDESIEVAIKRLESYLGIEKVLYVSLTWNGENRFGGGTGTDIGLKKDGEHLLEFLHEKKIAIDLSHASDRLAHDIFTIMEKNHWNVPVMASHSNFRAVKDHPRNLPEEFVKEINRRQGVIGLNLVKKFVGNDPEDFLDHLQMGLELAPHAICMGADYYGDATFFTPVNPSGVTSPYFDGLGNSSIYPHLQEILCSRVSLELIDSIFWKNGLRFINCCINKA